jgi:hypothetical protein
MKKYEYKVINHTQELPEPYLNELGEEGWELVSLVATEVEIKYIYVFKREKGSKKVNG